MRNIGVFTVTPVTSTELIDFVHAYSSRHGQPCIDRQDEMVVGREPDSLYIFTDTTPTHGYFGDEELKQLEDVMRASPRSYVNIHFTLTDRAFDLAEALARQMQQRWGGILDYGGTGGGLDVPPIRRRTHERHREQ